MKKLFKKLALMVVALLTFSVGSNYIVKEVKAAEDIVFNINYKDGYISNYDGSEGTLTVTDETSTHTLEYTHSGVKTQSSASSTTPYSYAFYLQGKGYIYSSNIIEGYYPSSTIVTFTSGTSGSGKIGTTFSSSISSSLVSVSNSVTQGGTYEAKNDVTTNLYWNISTASKNVQITNIKIVYSSLASPIVSISGESYTQVGNEIILSESHENITGTAVWSSSDETVATVENGVVTAKKMGKTTIKADINGTYDEMEITVYPVAQSLLSIADAIIVCELTGNENSPYDYSAKGIVSNLEYSEEYGSYSATISDTENSIKVYGMTGEGNIVNGANITVTGKLVNYNNSTPEFALGCTYVADEIDYKKLIEDNLTTASLGFDFTYDQKEVTETVPATVETISFSSTEQRTSFSTSQQVWKNNNITFTNNKSSSTSNVADYSNPVRLYKSSEIVIEATATITKIEFTASSSDYATALNDSIEEGIHEVNGTTVTWTGIENEKKWTISTLGAQVRLSSITVTYGGSVETTLVNDYTASTFDNISILFGVEIDDALFATFTTVTAGVKFESEGDYLFDRQVTINPENGYSFGVVFEVVPDKTTLSDEKIKARLNTVIKATAYFVVDGTTVELQPSEVSVKSMVETYTTDEKYTSNATVQEYAGALNALKAYIG